MPPAGFEPTIPASEWPQTHALDRAVTWSNAVTLPNIFFLLASFLHYILQEPADHSLQICVTRLSSSTLEHEHTCISPILLSSTESPDNSKRAFVGRLTQSFANVNENITPCSGPFLQIFRKQQHLNDGQ